MDRETTQVASFAESASRSCPVRALGYTAFKSPHDAVDLVQCEGEIGIRVDGRMVCTLCCSADHLVELAVGHLLTQGVIGSCDDIAALSLDGPACVVKVTLRQPARFVAPTDAPARIASSGTRFSPALLAPLEPFRDVMWTESWIYAVAGEFAQDKTSHARTRGCHSAYLADRGGVLCMREDIGRHNAFDKVVGWALLHGVDLGQCLLYTSGRVPTDMVLKSIRARIPVLASKSVTTDKAIDIARAAGLVLLCEARPESFALMSGNAPATEDLRALIG